MARLIGTSLPLKVIEINRHRNRLILSERQAVQLSLLVLLASVFFSGFVLSIDEFIPQVRALAYALPVTHGIRLAQDVMLRGWTNEVWHVWALLGIALVLIVASWALLRRGMARI